MTSEVENHPREHEIAPSIADTVRLFGTFVERSLGERDADTARTQASEESTVPDEPTLVVHLASERTLVVEIPAELLALNEREGLSSDLPSRSPTSGAGANMPEEDAARLFADMAVLFRYGHQSEVIAGIQEQVKNFGRDLKLREQAADFFREHDLPKAAIHQFFQIVGLHFDNRNAEGMRHALTAILELAPGHPEATKLLALLTPSV